MNVVISGKGLAWFNTGHPWIYRSDVKMADVRRPPFAPASADECIVNVLSESGRFLAKAFYNPKSEITLRIITRKEEDVDRKFWQVRVQKAVDYRSQIIKDASAYRLVFGESDGLPGLIVDRYADTLVIQTNTLGMDLLKAEIAEILKDILKPECIVLRNDSSARKLEGLKEEKAVIFGDKPGLIEACEGDIKYLVDVWAGHKTGAYLDQAENRLSVADIVGAGPCARPIKKILDAFCYHGLFSLHLAKKAEEVIAVDSSKEALDMLGKNASLNNINNIKPLNANVFDKLKEFALNGEKFDVVVLDPPALAKSKKDVANARRGYKDLNLRAMRCLNDGGYLASFSCSYNFSEEEFLHSIRLAAAGAKRNLYIAAKLFQSKDHPINIAFPESNYLKGFIFQVR